jgi:mannose-1-phosphate guanylyltransferase
VRGMNKEVVQEHFYAVIMAGGGGTRLWPLSRRVRPKHMLSLFHEQTLFQMAVRRLNGMFPPERIFVVTIEAQLIELRAQCPEIPLENYLIEPMPRGTAAVIGLAAIVLQARDPQAIMAVLTADHFMENETSFQQLLSAASQVARDGYLVTLGIQPTFPATGYGYIQRGERLASYQGLEVYQVQRFKEKPDETTAQQMILSGDHDWNSGMFVWRVEQILAEFDRQMPELADRLAEIGGAWLTPERQSILQRIWPQIKAETIDYGIMEGARDVAVIPAASLGWSDVGSWDTLFDVLDHDQDGNIIFGKNFIGLDTHNSLVFADSADRLVVTIGVDDIVLVDTGDALLVCRRDQAQKVRQLVGQLKTQGSKYL